MRKIFCDVCGKEVSREELAAIYCMSRIMGEGIPEIREGCRECADKITERDKELREQYEKQLRAFIEEFRRSK